MGVENFFAPIAVFISALGAWFFAAKSIETAQDISRRRTTFDYLSQSNSDRDYINAKNTFLELRMGRKKLLAVAEEYEQLKANGNADKDLLARTIPEHSTIRNFLNGYEALAIAIKSGTLDKEIIRQNIQQEFVEDVDSCREFIEHTRRHCGYKKPETIWFEAQALAEEWRL